MKKLLTYIFTGCMLLICPAQLAAMDLRISWTAVQYPSSASYNVYEREFNTVYDYRFPIWTGDATSCVLYNFREVVDHFFIVRTQDDYGNESVNSEEVVAPRPLPEYEPLPEPPSRIEDSESSKGCFLGAVL